MDSHEKQSETRLDLKALTLFGKRLLGITTGSDREAERI
jgi:hypothetical protein